MCRYWWPSAWAKTAIRKVLGIAEGHKEDKAGWSGFLKHLKDRGLVDVQLIISDACMGLVESVLNTIPRRNGNAVRYIFTATSSAWCRASTCAPVADMLKAIHASEDRQAAQDKAEAVIEKLTAMRLKEAAAKVSDAIAETLAFYGFPAPHWRRIRTNNPLERIMREIRRGPELSVRFRMGNQP